MGLQIAGLPFLQLHLEPPPLVYGIVEFREGVGNLLSADVELETVDEGGVNSVSPGERLDLHGVMGDEDRLNELCLDLLVEDGHQHLAGWIAFLHIEP